MVFLLFCDFDFPAATALAERYFYMDIIRDNIKSNYKESTELWH